MLFANPQARRSAYDPALQAVLHLAAGRESRRWLSGWDQLHPGPTPLVALPGLARRLGLAALHLKDEGLRSPLGSFKVLGAPAALLRLVQRRWPQAGWQPADLLAGRHAAALQDLVVTSATDGNHGRALAAAARSLGCRCVIVLHAQVSPEREDPIRALGADIVRIAGHYDEAVQEAARLAHAHGWEVVSDTSYPGYESIPRDVMQGYAVIADELFDALPAGAPCPFSHVVLQGGVGGLAAGITSAFWERWGAQRPQLLVVEPVQADCLLQSARQGRAARATGSVDSLMAGLACGEASPLAWRFLQPAVDHFLTVEDAQARQAMVQLATGATGDQPVLAGESGAAGIAALNVLLADPAQAAATGLGDQARVLCINTEAATAPGLYEALTGLAPAAVARARAGWLARQGAPDPAPAHTRPLPTA